MGVGLAASTAAASPTIFNDRVTWEGAVGQPLVTETFEDEALGFVTDPATFATGLIAGVVGSDISMRIEAGDPDGISADNTTVNGRKYLRYGAANETGTYSARFTLPTASTVFGFDISAWQPSSAAGGVPGQGGMNITLIGDGVFEDFFFQSDATFDDLTFIGITNNAAFTEVRLSITQLQFQGFGTEADDVAFDQVSFIPTPSAAAALVVAGTLATRRRRSRTARSR